MSISTVIDYNRFYQLEDPLTKRSQRLTVRGLSDWVTSDYAWKLFRGQVNVEQPVQLIGYMGGQVTDFLWSDLVHMVCISNKVVDALRATGVTGWSTYPVEVYERNNDPLSGYQGFAVTGGECRRDRSRSQIITRQAVPGGKTYELYKGLYFYEEDWDGSDIFWVKSSGGIIVTEKVFISLKRTKVTYVKLIPLPDVELQVLLDKYDHDL